MKTSDLFGPALDWVVAKCENIADIEFSFDVYKTWWCFRGAPGGVGYIDYSPSTDWSQSGPIIEREKYDFGWRPRQQTWYAYRKQHGIDGHVVESGFGPTMLIAAMRCYVASKLGDEVNVPEELK